LKSELEYGGTPLEAAVARLHRTPVVPDSVPPRLTELLLAMTALEDTARPDARQCAEALSALSAEGLMPSAANTVGPDVADSGRDAHAGAGTPTEEGPALTAAGPGIRHQASKPLRTRRPLLVTGAAVLTALLGTTLAVSLDGAENSADRSAPSSVESTPPQRTSPTTSAESPQKATGQPAASTAAPPSKAPRPSTSAASNPQVRRLSSDPTSGPPRPCAAQANDKKASKKSTKSKGRHAGKKHG
jgi:hypothetical protein